MPVAEFLARIEREGIPRVPGTAVFLTRTRSNVPPVLVWHLKQNRALHAKLIVLTVLTESTPWVAEEQRTAYETLAPQFWRVTARFGFMERPDIPAVLAGIHLMGCNVDLDDVTYYLGHETVVPGEDDDALPRWVEALYATMQRNAAQVSGYFRLPLDSVVELGREVSI
jgi:KUP system potassium uptake protein